MGVFLALVGTSRGLMIASSIVITLMMVHIGADVIGKYFFNAPVHGTLEIVSLYYMVAIVYLPLAWGSHDGDQIKVELFTRRLPKAYLERHDGVGDFLLACFFGVIAWQSAIDALAKTKVAEMRETAIDLLIVWPSRWIVPLGFGVAGLFHIVRGVYRLIDRK